MKKYWTIARCMVLTGFAKINVHAQAPSLQEILNFETITELTSSEKDNVLAWTSNYKSRRNVFIAKSPNYTATEVTSFSEKEEQEISGLKIFSDTPICPFQKVSAQVFP